MASKRRYHPIKDTEGAYHSEFDKLRMNSIILNKNARLNSDRAVNFNNRTDLKKLLLELEGKQAEANEQLLQINKQQDSIEKQNEVSGLSKKPVPHLHKERLRTEAACDVLEEERTELNRLIGNIGEVKSQILQYGPRGVGIIRGNVLRQLDGQRIEINAKGVLVIADGIYNGIPVNVYNDCIQKPWKIAHGQLKAEQLKLEKTLARQEARSEFNERWESRKKELLKENPSWNKLFSINIEGCPAMPDPALAKIKAS